MFCCICNSPPEEQFTIKLYLDGKFEENPKSYRGGSVHYIDFCEGDQTSLLELYSMIVSCGSEVFFSDCGITCQAPL